MKANESNLNGKRLTANQIAKLLEVQAQIRFLRKFVAGDFDSYEADIQDLLNGVDTDYEVDVIIRQSKRFIDYHSKVADYVMEV